MSVLVKTHAIPDSWEEYDLQEGLQNFLVVVEMVFFAIAHYYVFSHKPYIDPAAAQVPCIATCLRMLDVRDVADDVRQHFVDPLPRPKFRTGRGGGVSFSSTSSSNSSMSEPGRGRESSEESPLLGKSTSNRNRAHSGSAASDGNDATSHVTMSDGGGGSGKLSDLSYDILTYRELDSRTKYGLRARMIANACREEDDEAGNDSVEEEGQEGEEGEESSTSSQPSQQGQSVELLSPLDSQLSPTRARSPLTEL